MINPCHICGAKFPEPHGMFCSAVWPKENKMAVLDADMVRLDFQDGDMLNVKLTDLFMDPVWPPPEKIQALGFYWKRVSFSQMTDEQANHPNLARGALYHVDHEAMATAEAIENEGEAS